MKLRVELDAEEYSMDLKQTGEDYEFVLSGSTSAAGKASVLEIAAGVFSVLLGGESFTVHIARKSAILQAWSRAQRHTISVADVRDRSGASKKVQAAGPLEVRAQMPGKIVKVLVESGAKVHAGQGLIVVEAMKMQNEMKSPKDGIVAKIRVRDGATVSAGETLVVVE